MTKEASLLIKNTNGFCLLKAHQNDGFLSVETSWPFFLICKLQKKLFLHTQFPILFWVEFWKQQISSKYIRSSYFSVPLRDIYSMNIFRLFLQREGKRSCFSVFKQIQCGWSFPAFPELQSCSTLLLLNSHKGSAGGTFYQFFLPSFVGSLDRPIGVLSQYVVLGTGPS